MFQQVDSAIGFATVMLLLSLLITAGVQMVSAALDLRGYYLRLGIVKLLKQIVPELRKFSPQPNGKGTPLRTLADEVADAAVHHPSIQVGISRLKAVRLDEVMKILDDLASDTPMQPNALSESARKALVAALAPAIPDGTQTIAAAESVVNALLNKFPTIKKDVQHAIDAKLIPVRKIEHDAAAWFAMIMDRTSDSFVRHTRGITIAVAALLVLAVQVDAGNIWNQLSASPELRANLLKLSDSAAADADRILAAGPNGTQPLEDVKKNAENLQTVRSDLAKTQLSIIYPGLKLENWGTTLIMPAHLAGVLVSIVLLSLGAPFWFNTLRQLSNLKPATANKIEKETSGSAGS